MARTAKRLRDPRDPTAAERATHEASQLPFRSCCVECVVRRRDNPPHRRTAGFPKTRVPEILMNCCYAQRDDETETVTLMKDRYSRAVQARVVERKYLELDAADVTQRALMGLRSLGHRGRVFIKTDNEQSILSLKEEMMRRLEVGVIPVESAAPPPPPPCP